MGWSDRGKRGTNRGGGRPTGVTLAVLLLLAFVALSGVLAPGGPVAVTFPLIGGGAEPVDADASGETAEAEGIDRDADGLLDEVEADFGTDPTASDTDGDGYPDGMEVACEDGLPGADPLRQDVYLEVDSVADASLSASTVEHLETSFGSAPVENPHGTDGIALHVVESDGSLAEDGPVNNRRTPGKYTDVTDYREDYFDRADLGYHYLVVVSDAAYNGDRSYAGAGHRGTVVVENYDRDEVMASLVMHELGHAFGITHGVDGVDDDQYSLEEYDSVMNYNGIYEVMTYSDGDDDVGRDEWAFVADGRHQPSVECSSGDCLELCSRPA